MKIAKKSLIICKEIEIFSETDSILNGPKDLFPELRHGSGVELEEENEIHTELRPDSSYSLRYIVEYFKTF